MTATLAQLRARLPALMLRDQQRLARRADRARSLPPAAREAAVAGLETEVAAAEARIAARRASVPVISFPPELPVSQRKDDLAAAIRYHQVVIIAGETGSGKTTQLPKICLELGRGITGQIGHTQPRRIAARTVADRIAAELKTELGTTVGFKVRFADNSSDDPLIKVMTDGILLTEMQRDRQLRRYDTLIIDEAHERSLNIDFILGYLKQLLPRRPDLKVIVTSATIDPERFSDHFGGAESGLHSGGAESGQHSEPDRQTCTAEPNQASTAGGAESGQHSGGPNQASAARSRIESAQRRHGAESSQHSGGAPIVEVSGRTYPVEVRYRPLTTADDGDGVSGPEPKDQIHGIGDAVAELRREGPGDILVFLSGEREIRDTADALAGEPGLEILPLYARLSAAEQYRVFQPHQGTRVVLATNVAETSLTVPGIRYVIDPGTARISRYSQRTKVQRLPIEAISRASAEQRKGRCGRTSDGICIRLYSEEDFDSRPEFTDPEILRTNLASVILRMAALDLGVVADFPFVDPPDSRNVADGLRLLEELGAIAPGGTGAVTRLTDTGRKLAELPVDPRLGRMILEAGRNGCLREVLVITAALAIQDPRERPADAREAADAMHRRFAEPGSDFLAFLTLWEYLREQQRELSSSAFRRTCRREFLHYLRVREWQDVYSQLQQAARDLGILVGRGGGGVPPSDATTASAPASRVLEPCRRGGKPGCGVGARLPAAAHCSDRGDHGYSRRRHGLGRHGLSRQPLGKRWFRRRCHSHGRSRRVRRRAILSRSGRAGAPVGPRRSAVAHRHARSRAQARRPAAGRAQCGRRPPAGAGGVRRSPRRAVRDLPGLAAGAQAAVLGHGGRARRDITAVGPHYRAHRARMGRVPRRRPCPAQLQRAALGRPSRRRHGRRKGGPLRPADSRSASGELRQR